jgi:Protein of unknown function (DUF998)
MSFNLALGLSVSLVDQVTCLVVTTCPATADLGVDEGEDERTTGCADCVRSRRFGDTWTGSMMAITSVAALVALIAVGAFSLLLALLHVLKPEIDPSWRMISEYEIGRHGWIMRLAFLCWAASVVAVAVALGPHASPLGSAALVAVALGPLGAAIFATDPITTPTASTSVAHRWHALFGAVFILGFPIAATLASWSAAGADPSAALHLWPPWLWWVPWSGLIVFIGSAVVFQATGKGRAGPDVPIGWPNRFLVVTYVAWLTVAAWTMLYG